VDDRGKNRDGDRVSDSPKTSQMEIGGTSEVGDSGVARQLCARGEL